MIKTYPLVLEGLVDGAVELPRVGVVQAVLLEQLHHHVPEADRGERGEAQGQTQAHRELNREGDTQIHRHKHTIANLHPPSLCPSVHNSTLPLLHYEMSLTA